MTAPTSPGDRPMTETEARHRFAEPEDADEAGEFIRRLLSDRAEVRAMLAATDDWDRRATLNGELRFTMARLRAVEKWLREAERAHGEFLGAVSFRILALDADAEEMREWLRRLDGQHQSLRRDNNRHVAHMRLNFIYADLASLHRWGASLALQGA